MTSMSYRSIRGQVEPLLLPEIVPLGSPSSSASSMPIPAAPSSSPTAPGSVSVQGIFSGYVRLFNINIQNLGDSREFWEIRAGGHKQITQKIFSGHKVYVYVIFGY